MGFVTMVGRVARRVLRGLVSTNVFFDMAHPLILRRGSARQACRRMGLGDVHDGFWRALYPPLESAISPGP